MILLNLLPITIIMIADVVTVLHVVMDNRQPAKTMAWVLLICFLPVVGVVLYIFFGLNTRRERLISVRSLNQLSKRSMFSFVEQHDFSVPDEHRKLVDLFINQNFSLPFKGSVDAVFTEGRPFFDDLLATIASARQHIHINVYIFEADTLGTRMADALIAKAREGVEVRLIYDDVGCWRVSDSFFEAMKEGGIEVCPFLPVRFPTFARKINYRNHRKMIIVDGRVGYIGGMNIARRYAEGVGGQPWRDTMVRISGPAVFGLQRAFLIDWYFVDRTLISNKRYYPEELLADGGATGEPTLIQTVTSGPLSPYPELMQGYVRLILGARRYVYIETPYFMPSEPVMFALKTAAQGGVDVRLIVPLRGDSRFVEWSSRSYLRAAADAGVKIFFYERGFIHSKMLVCDDGIAVCGSANIDFRSMENNFEANAFFYGNSNAVSFREIFLDDQSRSIPFADCPAYRRRTFFVRLIESIARLMAPLF